MIFFLELAKKYPHRNFLFEKIALDILEQEGFNAKIIARARDVVAHPEKYKAAFKKS